MNLNVIRIALYYSTSLFVIGFLFGALRVIILASKIGAFNAVLIEIFSMLFLSFMIFNGELRKFNGKMQLFDAALIIILSFVLLQFYEILFGKLLFKISFNTYLANLHSLVGGLGFIGQIACIALPVGFAVLKSKSKQ